MKNLLLSFFVASLFACNSGETKNTDTTKSNADTNAAAAANKPVVQPATAGDLSFQINGQVANTNGTDKNSATFAEADKNLTINLHGFIAPDTYGHQLAIMVKNFTAGTTGAITTATAQFSRKDENKKDFIYGNRTAGSFKLIITKWENKDSGPMDKAIISGTFEGGLNCETCNDPALKNSPFSQTQHITAGTFENIHVLVTK